MTAVSTRIGAFLGSRWSLSLGIGLLVIAGAAILGPVLFSSVDADDTHWILETPAHTHGSYWQAIVWSFTDVPAQSPDQGRFSQFAYAMQRIMDIATMNSAVALSVPPLVIRAVFKVLLLLAGIAAVLAFARSLRRRLPDGRISGLSVGESLLFAALVAVLVPIGAKSMMLGSFNGWISYPVLTYGAVPIIFGSGALILWLYRGLQRRFALYSVISAVTLVVLMAFITMSYELYYLVFPMMVVSLILQPRIARQGSGRDGAKILLLTVATALFGISFAVTRIYVTVACASGGCYTGVLAGSLGGTLRTTLDNLVSALPGASLNYAGQGALEVAPPAPQTPTHWSIAVGIALGLGLVLLVLWIMNRHRPHAVDASVDDASTSPLLLRLAALSACVALGGAVLMAVSVKAQASVTLWSVPFRSGVLIWFALASAIAALIVFAIKRSPRSRVYITVALGCVVAISVAGSAPINYYAAQNARLNPVTRSIDRIHDEVAVGDLSAAADAARCELISTFNQQMGTDLHGERTIAGAYAAFEHYYGVPFCSQLIGPYNKVPTTIY
ncbi:hypothetical protein [Mycetocola sp. JXN-3]|uniref:hypothetical protein n=1 Tax=Mycetocola sp. JXN-3 TaxID=2116510 RepID=UPI00165D1FB3|nr:hypothetical protein [Mycetocola sp. JXN-3]